MNFGNIKDIYAKFLVDSYLNESKQSKHKKHYKNFIKMVSENQILRTQFIVYKNIEKLLAVSQIGLINPLATAWELMPFSFVIDWAIS